jgi:hypothetical protein
MSLRTTVPHAGRSPMQPQASQAFAAFLGLDWADAQHDVCRQTAGTAQREFLSLDHRPAEMNAWGQTLRTRFNGQPVAVGLELTTGSIVSARRTSDFLVLLPVKPLTVAQYRAAFTPRRAKKPTPPMPSHQSLDQCPEQLLSPRPAVVSGQRYGDLWRLPEPLADAQSGPTRPSHPS